MTIAAVFAGLFALLLTGMPIFAALGLTATAILVVAEGNIGSVADTVFASFNKSILVAIPLFVFMAQVMIRAKVIDDLYDMANAVVGHVRGGLGVATVMSCTIFAAISGSSVATALSIGSSAIPQMRRFGYPARDAYGVIAAGGTLGILIPPSGPMILYAIISDSSIGALFLAGVIPGVLLAAIFALFCVAQASTRRDVQRQPWAGWPTVLRTVGRSIWAVLMPPVVLGGIYLGIFTASEAAAAGSVYALLVARFAYRSFSLRDLFACAYETMRTTVMVFMILAGAAMFGHAVTLIRLPVGVMEAVAGLGLTPTAFILTVMVLIFLLGMFLETISIILITTPIILPAMTVLGIDPVWYGVMLMINLELALITPPVGMNLFVIKGITEAPLGEVIRGALPYVLLMIAGLLVVLAVPQLALWLPTSAGFGR